MYKLNKCRELCGNLSYSSSNCYCSEFLEGKTFIGFEERCCRIIHVVYMFTPVCLHSELSHKVYQDMGNVQCREKCYFIAIFMHQIAISQFLFEQVLLKSKTLKNTQDSSVSG